MTALSTIDCLMALRTTRIATQMRGAVSSCAWPQVVTDSRDVQPGDVFWALPRPNHDGADFIADAWLRGAAGVVTERALVNPPAGRWALVVDSAERALHQLARWQRDRFAGTVVAVAGSVGKSTTRQLLDIVLRERLTGSSAPRNLNTLVGNSLAQLNWRPHDDFGLSELAARRAGEVAALAAAVRPQVGVLTRIGDAHLETFGDRATIARSHGELLDWLPADGFAVLNADDAAIRRQASRTRATVLWYGRSVDAQFRASDVVSANGELSFMVDGLRLSLPAWGRHQLSAALASVAVARGVFGLDWFAVAAGLRRFRPLPQRCQALQVRGALVLNDTYNASPLAMTAALELLGETATLGRRIVLCGGMLELGAEACALHQQAGRQVVQLAGADELITVGPQASAVASGARLAGLPTDKITECETVDEAAAKLLLELRAGDVVLLKASRAVGLERVIDRLSESELDRLAA